MPCKALDGLSEIKAAGVCLLALRHVAKSNGMAAQWRA
jgi:hypothetical protein